MENKSSLHGLELRKTLAGIKRRAGTVVRLEEEDLPNTSSLEIFDKQPCVDFVNYYLFSQQKHSLTRIRDMRKGKLKQGVNINAKVLEQFKNARISAKDIAFDRQSMNAGLTRRHYTAPFLVDIKTIAQTKLDPHEDGLGEEQLNGRSSAAKSRKIYSDLVSKNRLDSCKTSDISAQLKHNANVLLSCLKTWGEDLAKLPVDELPNDSKCQESDDAILPSLCSIPDIEMLTAPQNISHEKLPPSPISPSRCSFPDTKKLTSPQNISHEKLPPSPSSSSTPNSLSPTVSCSTGTIPPMSPKSIAQTRLDPHEAGLGEEQLNGRSSAAESRKIYSDLVSKNRLDSCKASDISAQLETDANILLSCLKASGEDPAKLPDEELPNDSEPEECDGAISQSQCSFKEKLTAPENVSHEKLPPSPSSSSTPKSLSSTVSCSTDTITPMSPKLIARIKREHDLGAPKIDQVFCNSANGTLIAAPTLDPLEHVFKVPETPAPKKIIQPVHRVSFPVNNLILGKSQQVFAMPRIPSAAQSLVRPSQRHQGKRPAPDKQNLESIRKQIESAESEDRFVKFKNAAMVAEKCKFPEIRVYTYGEYMICPICTKPFRKGGEATYRSHMLTFHAIDLGSKYPLDKYDGDGEDEDSDVTCWFRCLRCRTLLMDESTHPHSISCKKAYNTTLDIPYDRIQVNLKSPQDDFKDYQLGCGICQGNNFYSQPKLREHLKTIHPEVSPKVLLMPAYRCGACLLKFKDTIELTKHCLVCNSRPKEPELLEIALALRNCTCCPKKHVTIEESIECYASVGIERCVLCLHGKGTSGTMLGHFEKFHTGSTKLGFCQLCTGMDGRKVYPDVKELFDHMVKCHFGPILQRKERKEMREYQDTLKAQKLAEQAQAATDEAMNRAKLHAKSMEILKDNKDNNDYKVRALLQSQRPLLPKPILSSTAEDGTGSYKSYPSPGCPLTAAVAPTSRVVSNPSNFGSVNQPNPESVPVIVAVTSGREAESVIQGNHLDASKVNSSSTIHRPLLPIRKSEFIPIDLASILGRAGE